MALTPVDWIRLIDKKADQAIQGGWSRRSLEWGKWSAEMNRYIRSQINGGDANSAKFKFVFLYWIMMSQAIEFAFKRKEGYKINEQRFSDTVKFLEHMKESIKKDCWPDYSLNEIQNLMVGVA